MDISRLIAQFLGRTPTQGPPTPMPAEVVPMMQGAPGQNYMAGGFDPAAQQYAVLPGQEASVEVGALPPGVQAAQIPGQPRRGIKERMRRNAGPGAQNFMGGGAMTFNVPKNVSGGLRKAIGKLF